MEKIDKNNCALKFTVFADMHYREGMYIASIEDLDDILSRGHNNASDFVIHCGDLCNDYNGSPELINAYINNKYALPVYGVYGNHELERQPNSMEAVTPYLTNRTNSIVWGTHNKILTDGLVAYYYFDIKGFRIICTDTNYSYNPKAEEWVHNETGSWGAPAGNLYENSLGPIQLKWLEETLFDAANKKLKCIVVSHASFSKIWGSSPDSDTVLKIFDAANKQTPQTVIMSINGHYHTNHIALKNNIVFFDVNTVRNGDWRPAKSHHYTPDQKFDFTEYDDNGTAVKKYMRSLTELTQGMNTYFFSSPLSANVSISKNGDIKIEGTRSEWIYGVVPEVSLTEKSIIPEISDFEHSADID